LGRKYRAERKQGGGMRAPLKRNKINVRSDSYARPGLGKGPGREKPSEKKEVEKKNEKVGGKTGFRRNLLQGRCHDRALRQGWSIPVLTHEGGGRGKNVGGVATEILSHEAFPETCRVSKHRTRKIEGKRANQFWRNGDRTLGIPTVVLRPKHQEGKRRWGSRGMKS